MAVTLFNRIAKHPIIARHWCDRTLLLFATDTVEPAPEHNYQLRVNDIGHIERFKQTEKWLTREAFIDSARKRIETPGQYIVTVAEETGPLLGYVMGTANAGQSYFPYVDATIKWPTRTGTLMGTYVLPEARGRRINRILGAERVRVLLQDFGMNWVVNAIHSDNSASLKSNARGSTRLVAEVNLRRRLGKETKSMTRHNAFPDFLIDVS